MRLKVAIGVGTFILGLFTVIVPVFAIPDCVPENMAVTPRPIKPFEPFVRPQSTLNALCSETYAGSCRLCCALCALLLSCACSQVV